MKITKLTLNGSVKHTLMITRMCVGVLIQVAIIVLSIKIQVCQRSYVNVEITFASDAVGNHIDLAIAKLLNNGSSRIQQKVKTLLGLWQIQSNVLSAENLLRRTKVVIICHARCAVMSFVGYV